MMSHRRRPHHKICGLLIAREQVTKRRDSAVQRSPEAGYTLVALLALMTLLALFATAAAPSIRQQAQREREKETIFRGEQVADAIRDYYINRSTIGGRGPGPQSLPTSIDDLLEGIPVTGGSKKRQILRASAGRDSLSSSGEWRLIAPRSQRLVDFQRSVMIYANNFLPEPKPQQMVELQRFAAPPIVNVIETESDNPPSNDVDSAADSSGPFVGVSIRSQKDSVLYYYGIDRHDQWIFTPLFRQ
jgi:type II secretory pathway pseudopilin PulG